MVLYKCPCGNFETERKGNMRQHLNRMTSCIPGKNMKLIDIDSLADNLGRKPNEDLSHLTQDEKKERNLIQTIHNKTKQRMLGNMSIKSFAKKILADMKHSSYRRNHKEPSWEVTDIIKLLQNNQTYFVHYF